MADIDRGTDRLSSPFGVIASMIAAAIAINARISSL